MMKRISIWEETAKQSVTFDQYRGDTKSEVVIIGGGISGITAAMILSKAGKQVVLLEARQIGLGTTGYSTGNLYVTVDEHLSALKKKWNSDVMKEVVASRTAALNFIEQTITSNKIDCDFVKTSFNYFAEELDDHAEKFIQEELDALMEAGLSPRILENCGLPFNTRRCLSVDGQAQFNPLKYVRSIASSLTGKCRIYENSQMIKVDEDKKTVYT